MGDELLEFAGFVQRIRAGEQNAALELIQRYEPLVRREIRMRLVDPRLASAFDSMDICQSVWASFFVRTAAGQFDLERPDQLLKLLVTIARNKLASAAREANRECRDHRRVEPQSDGAWSAIPTGEASPSQIIEARDLLSCFLHQLSGEERKLAEMRMQGSDWSEIAAEMGGTAQARRMQLSRAVDRAAVSLGIDEVAS